MSVIRAPDVTPSRLIGIFRYLLRAEGQRIAQGQLERVLMPESLMDYEAQERDPRGALQENIREGVAMHLFAKEGDLLTLHPDLPEEVLARDYSEDDLSIAIANLLFDSEDGRNDNLGYAVAWYLSRDPYNAPAGKNDVPTAISNDGWGKADVTSDATFTTFRDWTCYLGFAWQHAQDSSPVLTPDPTAHLRRRLPELFDEPGQERPLPGVLSQLAGLCPVFEGGRFREEVESMLEARTENHLSASTALALLRLSEGQTIELVPKSDTEVRVLPDGGETHRYSHVVWTPG